MSGTLGVCHALFAFDLGYSISTREAGRILDVAPTRLGVRRRRRSATELLHEPLRLRMQTEPVELEDGSRTEPDADVSVHRSGGATIGWRLPVPDDWERAVSQADTLFASRRLGARSRRLAERLVDILAEAVERPAVDQASEAYRVYCLSFEAGELDLEDRLWRTRLARLLRAESGELSGQEQAGALADPIAYHPAEACLVDWMGAVLIGPDMEQELHSLELANLELLELRVLDRRLGEAVGRAKSLAHRRVGLLGRLALPTGSLGELSRLRVDFAALHETVDNAVETFGDDYLARVYRRAAERFHFAEWDAAIERKLGLLDAVSSQLTSLAATRRSEILEITIIVLIAVDIVLILLGHA